MLLAAALFPLDTTIGQDLERDLRGLREFLACRLILQFHIVRRNVMKLAELVQKSDKAAPDEARLLLARIGNRAHLTNCRLGSEGILCRRLDKGGHGVCERLADLRHETAAGELFRPRPPLEYLADGRQDETAAAHHVRREQELPHQRQGLDPASAPPPPL